MYANNVPLRRSRLSAALLAALLLPAGVALAQDSGQSTNNQQSSQSTSSSTSNSSTDQNNKKPEKSQELKRVVVTGSLIPQTEIETFTPVTTVTAQDIQARGFADIHDALAQASFSTGRVQKNETDGATFTKGARTVSMFGLPVGYTKYLINGIPMVDYPALYNGSDAFNNISGIPAALVDRIEIVPGGQSSLYGSDAIAGVVNVILKKRMEGGEVGARYGWYEHGGGLSKRISAAYGSSSGSFNWMGGFQWERTDPIWSSQRDLTKRANPNGNSPQTASRDYLVYGPFMPDGGYIFMDPTGCQNVTTQFGGTEGLRYREGRAQPYCGSYYTTGYRTLLNGKDSKQLYLRGTYDFDGGAQLYGNLLYNHEQTKFAQGAGYMWWGTGTKWGYYFDPRVDGPFAANYGIQGALLNLQRAFSPEDMGPGGFKNTMDKDTSDSYMVTAGLRGTFGNSDWDYDATLGRSQYKLREWSLARIADKIDQYFQDHVLGPQLGWDPLFGNYPVFEPDYSKFYTTMDPADFYSFMEGITSHSKTSNDILRAQLTNATLFSLPGGDAGLAIVGEAGQQKWEYNPDPRLLNGEIWGQTAVSGGGHRHRYALTAELRMPLFDMLTVTGSGRYDDYVVSGEDIDKATYAIGLEFRPWQSLLFRGKYGTAFKAATLADEFQGESGFYTFVPDYLRCYKSSGIEPADIDQCQWDSQQIRATQSGNPELKPINAKVWNVGTVWAPTPRLSFTVDYYGWNIKNEVSSQSLSGLLLDEYKCYTGELDANSPTCLDAAARITRNPDGSLETMNITKVNVAQETLRALTASVTYLLDAGRVGKFRLVGSYTNIHDHHSVAIAGDDPVDLLNDPYNSTDPKVRGNASISWKKNRWSSTLYADYIGHTPNNVAWTDSDRYDAPGAGKLASWTTYNLSIGYHPTDDFDLALRVTNLFDKMPDMDVQNYPGSSGSPYNYANFSVLGRRFYIQAQWRFGGNQ